MLNNNNNKKVNRKRIYFLFILFLVAFFLIIYRLISIQYLNASEYKNYAEYQHTGEFTIISKRGKILDRNGVELAVSLNEKTVYANPKLVVDSEYEAGVLAEILGIDESEVREKLDNKDLGFVYIQRKISTEKAEEISRHNLPGIYIQDESKRYYPLNDIAAPVIGFTGIDNNGLSGIELQYEKVLRGVDIKVTAEKDVFGNIIPVEDSQYGEPINGKDVVLTIDSQIQYMVQKKLEELTSEYDALRAICIVMNPENGEIYSMASYPGFDLNKYDEADPELYKIEGISFTYEPGSTFKIVNVSTALENNTVSKSQSFDLPPSIKVGDRVIREISRTYNVTYTTEEIIKHSSNVGAVTIALSMGEKMFWEGIKNFGFGEITGIELPGEEKGLFYDYKTWPASTIGALAIGQSISVTPLQLLRATCAIANGGYLITPSIVKEVELLENEDDNLQLDDRSRIISKETADSVKDMMLAVVDGGTGTRAQIEGVKVCGKTGTAEKANKDGVGYSEGRQIVSFVGFAPYENPQVAVIVVVDEPQGGESGIWGGTIAAPAFRDIMDFSLKRLKIN
ncbi:MAG: penicillin-binding protein 2 [Candidatus Humimicrobiaceae bacterium]|jgi:stage V sporulation protein D (sporulation-specific penicillin-binding protein)|nr:penicillin-binding protein 2 [Actinomycetota bacterium]MDY0027772.1 penicillin-binding protein 2 [Candidatus Humimicrobiaceae bacterium]